jgi:hypothetical protein
MRRSTISGLLREGQDFQKQRIGRLVGAQSCVDALQRQRDEPRRVGMDV